MAKENRYNEQDILKQISKSDQQAFALLIEQFSASVYSHVITYVKNALRAEEITQDIFMSVWNHRSELPTIQNFQGYLFVLTRNRTISAFREKLFKYVEEKDDLEASNLNPAGQLEYRQLSETLQKGIDQLPPRRKEIFTLSRFEGKNYEEIARQLNISKSAVNKHIVEALNFLRTFLRNEIGLFLFLCLLSTLA